MDRIRTRSPQKDELMQPTPLTATPLPWIAEISRLVTKITDRVTGDRSEFPLLVAAVTAESLRLCGIQANVFYGSAAWVEVMENQSLMWAGCWGSHTHFWAVTPFGEVVDLNTSVSHRKKAHGNPDHQPKFSPPLLWSREVPAFYRYLPEGIAEIELDSERDRRWFETAMNEIREKLSEPQRLLAVAEDSLDFPDEPILCPERRLLDDAGRTFQHYDRALMIQGIPPKPF
jgi:hypothetical protein